MSVNEPDKPPISDDSLDQLLREACWPEASPGTVTRLTQRWETVWTARRRREAVALADGRIGRRGNVAGSRHTGMAPTATD